MDEDNYIDPYEDDDSEVDDSEVERGDDDSDDPSAPLADGTRFADPGGRSALRAATRSNPRIHSCPTCCAPNVLTPADVARGYQCDRCADRAEGGGW